MEESLRIKVADLREFAISVLKKKGVPEADAAISTDVLISADQRGISSHGVQRLKRYVQEIEQGVVKAVTDFSVVRETPNTMLVAGGNGLGFVVAHRTMQQVIEKTLHNNVAIAAVRESSHFGIAGYYAMMALAHDCIGIAMTNTTPSVVPTFGYESLLGTNPIAVAVPAGATRPVVLDMATTVVTAGKLEMHRREGKKMPLNWAVDATGNVSDDAASVIDGFLGKRLGGLLPLGGAEEEGGGHKGYGLGFLVDILCGVLSGGTFGPQPYTVIDGKQQANVCHFFGAIKINAFIEPVVFKEMLDGYIGLLKSSRKRPGKDRIYIHGEKEWECYERQREAVAISRNVVEELRQVGRELDVNPGF